MRNLSWKLGIALLTFFVGTILAFACFTFELNPAESLEVSEPLVSEVKTPIVAPKTINLKDPSYLQGKKDAARDVKTGKLIIRVKGQTLFGSVLENELSKHKVKIQSIGCFFKDEDEKNLSGYNEVSKAATEERIGKIVLDEAMRKATEKDGDASQ